MEEGIDEQRNTNEMGGNNETLEKTGQNLMVQTDETQDIKNQSGVELENQEKSQNGQESVNDTSKISDVEKTHKNKYEEIQNKPSDTNNIKEQEINGEKTIGDFEQTKHVTYNEHVKIIETVAPDLEKLITFNEQQEMDSQDDKKNYGSAISDPNFKRKVTFSNEIIVIAYNYEDDEDENQPSEDDYNETETIQDRSKLKSGTLFGAAESRLDEITVNYADRVVNNRNIFKTVSFSNEVTVIHDGNLVFTSDSHECIREKRKKHGRKSSPSKVDKILTKLKKVVQKLEDKSHTHGGNRDQKVLGDAEQSKTCSHQVQVMNMKQKHVAFSDHVECIDNERNIEMREPNLRKVTFSNEIIVITYPYKNEDELNFPYEDSLDKDYTAMLGEKELLDKTKYEEIEESSVNYAEKVASNKNIFKTVSFSNEVTVIHDGNLVFRSDSTESVKDNFDVNKELECKE